MVDLSAVTAGAGIDVPAAAAAAALVSPGQVSHDAITTTPIYEHCGPPTLSTSPAERPVPRPRSTYGKYYLENIKNINAESKPVNISSPLNGSDYAEDDEDDDNDAFCR